MLFPASLRLMSIGKLYVHLYRNNWLAQYPYGVQGEELHKSRDGALIAKYMPDPTCAKLLFEIRYAHLKNWTSIGTVRQAFSSKHIKPKLHSRLGLILSWSKPHE